MTTASSLTRCRRRVGLVLALLFAAAALAIPTRSWDVTYQRDPRTNTVSKTTTRWSGYTLLPRFLARDREPFPAENSYAVRYALRRGLAVRQTRLAANGWMILVEAAVLAALAVFDFLFVCRRRRPSRLTGIPPLS